MWKEDRLVIIHTSQTVTFILIPEKLNKEGKEIQVKYLQTTQIINYDGE